VGVNRAGFGWSTATTATQQLAVLAHLRERALDHRLAADDAHRQRPLRAPGELAAAECHHVPLKKRPLLGTPARAFPSSIFRDKNRCDVGKSQSKRIAKDGNAWHTARATRRCRPRQSTGSAPPSRSRAALRTPTPRSRRPRTWRGTRRQRALRRRRGATQRPGAHSAPTKAATTDADPSMAAAAGGHRARPRL
jgi:hypothetical protein